MAKDDFEDFLSKITFAESQGKRTDSSGKLLEGPMTKYGTAKGELQVLDSTNKKPGYGVVAAKDDTPDERARVGRDYLKAMLDKFKDKRTAAIAYNWGPGNTQKWLDAGADEAGLPIETQNYVKKVMGAKTEVAKAPVAPDMAPAPRQAAGAPSVPAAPANRPIVSRETQGPEAAPEDRLSALGPSYQAAMALSYLGDTTNPAPQEDDEDGELRISGDRPREEDDVTKFLMEPSARSALADFDFKIQSPFAERVAAAPPVKRMAGGGDPSRSVLGAQQLQRPAEPYLRQQYPEVYGGLTGFTGIAPDEMGGSVLDPNTARVRAGAEYGFPVGTAAQVIPAIGLLAPAVKATARAISTATPGPASGSRAAQLGMFILARPEAAARHVKLQEKGLSPEQIRAQNLTLVDTRGNLIEEISDAPAVLQQKTASVPRNYYKMLKHPELESVYPAYDMPQVRMETTRRKNAPLASASFDDREGIRGQVRDLPQDNFQKMVRGTLLHEGQHAIQAQEGFIEGANPGSFIAYAQARRGAYHPNDMVNKNVVREMERVYPNLSEVADRVGMQLQENKYARFVYPDADKYIGETLYRHMPGEVQAELVRIRSMLTPEELKAVSLEESLKQLNIDPNNVLQLNKQGSRIDRQIGDIEYRAQGSPEEGEVSQEELDAASRPAFGNPNLARQVARTRALQANRSNDVNTLPDPQTYAFTQGMLGEAPDQLGFSPMHPDYKKIIGRGEQGMVTGGASMIGPTAKALKNLVGMGAKTLRPAASAAEMSKDYLQRQKAVSSGAEGADRMAIAQRNASLPVKQGGLGLPPDNTAMDRALAMGFDTEVFHGTSKDFLTFNPDKAVFAAELPEIANLYGKYRKGDGQRIMPLRIRGQQLTISDINDGGKTGQFGYHLAKKLNLPEEEIQKLLIPQVRYPNGELIPGVENLSTTFSDLGEREIINRLPKYGIDRLKVTDMPDMGGTQTQYMLPAGSDNVRSSFAAYDPFRRTAAVAAAMGAAAPDLLAGQEVNRAQGSPEEGEIKFKKDKEPSFDEKISEGMISGEVGDEGRFIRNSKTVSSKQLAELLKESNASLPASSVTSNAPPPRYINYDLNVGGWTYGFGPLKGQIVISGDKDTPQDPKDAMSNVNTQAHEAYHQRAAADKHSLLGKDKIINDPDWLARRRLEEIMEEFQPDSKKRKGSAPNSLASSYWGLNPNKSQEEQIASLAGYEGMHPKGTSFVDTEVGKKILKKYPSLIDYYFTQSSVPYSGIWEGQSKEPGIMDNAARMFKKFLLQKGFNTVNRAQGSPEEGEISQEELDAASKPSFRAQSSGMNRQRGPISDALNSGEAYTAVAKGLTNLPYNVAGAPMDLAMLARQGLTGQAPAGQVGTSDYIKNKMTELGIRQAPPTDPTLKGFYELGDLGSNFINPAAPVRGAVKVAEKTGEAAKMLAKDFQQYNQQLAAPGASYAVRAKGTPTIMSPVPHVSSDNLVYYFLNSMDNAEQNAFLNKNNINLWESSSPEGYGNLNPQIKNTPEFKNFATVFFAPRDEVTDLLNLNITQYLAQKRIDGPPVSVDPALNNWFLKTFSRYLRSDFASPSDQLVRAADEGKLLHLSPKELWFNIPEDRNLVKYLGNKKIDLNNTREAEGFPKNGMATTLYGKRVEDLIDLSAYPESIGDLSPNRVPISMRGLVETNPESRAMDFSPRIVKNLKLGELRDTMLEIRQSGGQYSAYGQPPAKVPPEFLLPDDTLAKLNVAAASNRVARFTNWQDEARQGMATTALRTDPRLKKDLSSDNKHISVFIPDLAKPENQGLRKLVTDVGCDGGWCTRQEDNALGYGSGDRSLSIVLTNDGKKARPVAQVSVQSERVPGSNNESHSIVDIAGKDNSYNFADNPALPAIQEHVKNLDYIYGGFEEIAYLDQLGMIKIPEEPMKLLNLIAKSPNYTTSSKESLRKLFDIHDAGTNSMSIGFGKVADEAVKLNKGSSLVVGNEDTMSELLQQALKNVTTPQPRAQGGFMERQSNDNRRYL